MTELTPEHERLIDNFARAVWQRDELIEQRDELLGLLCEAARLAHDGRVIPFDTLRAVDAAITRAQSAQPDQPAPNPLPAG